MRKKLIAILALLTCFFMTMSVACSNKGHEIGEFEAKFKEGARTEYYLGNEICLDDQIVRVNGTKAKVIISWTSLISGSEQTKELSGYGMYFFPEQLGEHTIEYIVSYKDTIKSATKTITVVKKPPNEHIITPEPEVYDEFENKLEGFDNVYKYSAGVEVVDGKIGEIALSKTLTDMKDASVKDTVAYIGFTKGFTVGSTLAINFTGKNLPSIGLFLDDAPEGTEIGGVSNAGTGLVFTNSSHWSCDRLVGCGPYRIFNKDHYNSTGNGGRVDSLTYFGPEFPDSAEMGRNHLEVNVNYRFEINLISASEETNTAVINFKFYKIGETKELVTEFEKTSTFEEINYNSTAFAFYNGTRPEYGRIKFTYELYNLNIENAVENVAGAHAKKADLVVEDGTIKSVTLAKTPNDILYTENSDNVAYLGFESGFEEGKAIAIDFTGKNLPMIGLFLDDAPETVKIGGIKDAGTGIIFTNCNPLWSLGRLIGVGPYRLYSSNETQKTNRVESLTYYGTEGNDSAEMGRANLEDGKNYRLEIHLVGASEENNKAELVFKFFEGSVEKAKFGLTSTLEQINYNSTAFAFYGTQRPEFGSITFSYELIDSDEEMVVEQFDAEIPVNGVNNAYSREAEVVVNAGKISKITLSQTKADNVLKTQSDIDSYVGFANGFGLGKTLSVSFTGKNMPGIGLFLENESQYAVIGGVKDAGTGLIFMNWYYGEARFNGYGPYRLFSSDESKVTGQNNTISYHGVGGIGTDTAELVREVLDDDTDYRLDISITNANESTNKATIVFSFYNVDTATELCTFTINSALSEINYDSTAFAFYGQPRAEFGETTFSYEIKTTMEVFGASETQSANSVGVYGKNAVTKVSEGKITSVTLNAATSDLLRNTDTDTVSYLVFANGFGVGKTLTIDFTGKNLPIIGLFLDGAPEGTVIGGLKDAGTGLVYMNCNPLRSLNRYVAYGPDRFLTSTGSTTGSHNDALGYYGLSDNESAEMGRSKLVDGTDYRFEIAILSASEESNSANYRMTLYIISEGTATQVASFTKTCTLADINYNSTAFAFYGAIRPEFGAITFSYKVETTMEVFGTTETKSNEISNVYGKGAVAEFKNGKIVSVTLDAPANDMLDASANDTAEYIGQSAGFGEGKTLAINFVGKNLPLIGLFLDGAPEGTTIGGLKDAGTGIVFTNCNPLWSVSRHIGVGPYRLLSSDSEKTTTRVNSLTYYGKTGTDSAETGRAQLVDGTSYRLEITLSNVDEESNTATIIFKLYEVGASGALTEKTNYSLNSTLAEVNYDSTAFAFYSAQRPEFGAVTFSYELYDTPSV